MDDLRSQREHERLALADTAHAVRRLREVAEAHVLGDRDDGLARGRLLDVHSSGMRLIVECKLRR